MESMQKLLLLLQRCLKKNPYSYHTLLRRIKIAYSRGHWNEVRDDALVVVELIKKINNYNKSYTDLTNLAAAYDYLRDYENELKVSEQVLKLNDKGIYSLKYHADKLKTYKGKGDIYYEKLLTVIDKEIKDNGHKYAVLYEMKAKTLFILKRYNSAIQVFNELLKIASDKLFVYNKLAWCYLNIGEYEKAINYAHNAWEISDEQEIANTLFNCYYLKNDLDRADKFLSLIKTKQNLYRIYQAIIHLKLNLK